MTPACNMSQGLNKNELYYMVAYNEGCLWIKGAKTALAEQALTLSWAHKLTNSKRKHGNCPPFLYLSLL
jgi:hypothetical protein